MTIDELKRFLLSMRPYHMIAQSSRNGQYTIDALVSSDESAGVSNSFRFLGQRRFVIDRQSNRLRATTQHRSTIADIRRYEHALTVDLTNDTSDTRRATAQDTLTTKLTVGRQVAVFKCREEISRRITLQILFQVLEQSNTSKRQNKNRSE